MANELVTIERELTQRGSHFEAVMGGTMTSRHLIQTVLVSIERNPKLLNCRPQTIINGAMTFANLRLPVDGATGQGFLLPFKEVCQPVIGYKGFNTIGARGGLTITGGVVREGDTEWDFREGTGGFVRHKKMLDNPGKIIAAWAVAESKTRPNAVSIVGIGELLEIMNRSPAVRGKADTPWNDAKVGRPAMMEKTAKRRLGRVLPFEIDDGRFLQAARLDEAYDEQGKPSYIDGRGALMIGNTPSPIAESQPSETPDAETLMSGRRDNELEALFKAGEVAAREGTIEFWSWWDALTKPEQLKLKPRLQSLRDIAENPGGKS